MASKDALFTVEIDVSGDYGLLYVVRARDALDAEFKCRRAKGSTGKATVTEVTFDKNGVAYLAQTR
jgi:hypothetical protein